MRIWQAGKKRQAVYIEPLTLKERIETAKFVRIEELAKLNEN